MRVNNQTLSGNVTITGTQNASMSTSYDCKWCNINSTKWWEVCSGMSTIVATNIQATNTQTDTIKHSGGNTAMTIASSGVVTPKTTSFVSVYAQGSSGYTNIF